MSAFAAVLQEAEREVKAGRFAQAESRASDVLRSEPRNAHAHYVMGLSALFQNRPHDALAPFEQAARLERSNPQYHFVTGMALAGAGRLDDAAAAYRRALQHRAQFFEALANLGNVHERAGRPAEAVEAYRRALQLRPGEVLVLNGLGVCLVAVGRYAEAVAPLERALQERPGFETVMNNLATALGKTGQAERAIALLQQAVATRPDFPEAWLNLGEQLYMARRDAEAIAAFDRLLALQPANDEVRYLRNAIAGIRMDRAPDQFVANFFDRFAPEFDRRLTGDLEYRTPQVLAALLEAWLARRSNLRVADLGCGTGLSGVFVRPKAARLVGVDLSGGMLEQARARGIYDALERDEIARFLGRCEPASLDLALAVDVFVYVGALDQVVAACAAALAPGGVFAFSVEDLAEGQGDFRLARTGRYAHARSYVERLAAAAGLAVTAAEPSFIRKEEGELVDGRLYLLEKR